MSDLDDSENPECRACGQSFDFSEGDADFVDGHDVYTCPNCGCRDAFDSFGAF